jgi:hypothetical protein
MTKPALAGPITRTLGSNYTTRVEYMGFLRGQSEGPKLSALTRVSSVISQEGRA